MRDAKKGIFGKPGDFDIDQDDEYCGIVGGEMADRHSVGPVWDWRPDQGTDKPAQSGYRCLEELDHNEFHTAREGSQRHGDREMGGQMDPVDRGTIEMFRGGHRLSMDTSEIDGADQYLDYESPGSQVDPVRAGSRQHGGSGPRGSGSPAVHGTDPYGDRTRGGQVSPARRGTRQ